MRRLNCLLGACWSGECLFVPVFVLDSSDNPFSCATFSVLVQMDKDFTTRTYTYYGLLTMLAHWGAIASFLFITFGITAMNFNKLFFMAQLGERDMQKMQKDNFDSHGRLRVKTFQVPAEAEQRKGEPLKEADMAMGYV